MLWHTLIITILTGSSIASLEFHPATLAEPTTLVHTLAVTSTASKPTFGMIPSRCHKEAGHVVCPKGTKADTGLIKLRPRAKKGTKKPKTGTKKPKASGSKKPKATKAGTAKPKTTKKPKSTHKPKVGKPAKPKCKRGDGSSAQGGQPACDAPVMGPFNQHEIPQSVTCDGIGNTAKTHNKYTHKDILAAVVRGTQLAAKNKQSTTRNYPHTFFNSENLKLMDDCAGKTVQEYPIIPGQVLDVSGRSKTDVGLDRVLFAYPAHVKPSDKWDEHDQHNGEVFYCGIVAHSGPAVNGRQPFHLCT